MKVRTFVSLVRSDFEAGRGRAGKFGIFTALIWRGSQLWTQGSLAGKLVAMPFVVLDIIWTKLLMGSDLPGTVSCGAGVVLPHGGRLLSINPRAKIGASVTIQQHVIIGNQLGSDFAPSVGDHVFIGPRATLLGGITIGAGSKIGAHAVVLSNVPDGAVAYGIPARYSRASDG